MTLLQTECPGYPGKKAYISRIHPVTPVTGEVCIHYDGTGRSARPPASGYYPGITGWQAETNDTDKDAGTMQSDTPHVPFHGDNCTWTNDQS
jgi:hypothetical protein